MTKLDILNRDVFVERLVTLTENISANKDSASFAINGVWGSGKSFVLDMYEEKLNQIQSEKTTFDKYCVIRYNCWKYDYYEEPLVAIVAVIIDIINQKTKLWNDEKKKARVLGVLKAIGTTLLSMANSSIKDKTGVDIQSACKTIKDNIKEEEEKIEQSHDYDVYFSFNQALQRLRELILELCQEQTVVFVVDELDRCLPEYSIKVLERLHHLTENVDNVITIISMDRAHLQKSVQQIFGFDHPEKYLEKFINFEIKLDCGVVSKKVTEKYADYIALFDKNIFLFDDSIEEFIQAIFMDIDVRMQEQLVKRATIAHKLLYTDSKDYTFMCMELLLTVLICAYNDNLCFDDKPINLRRQRNKPSIILAFSHQNAMITFDNFFNKKIDEINFTIRQDFPDDPQKYILPQKANLYGAVLFTWCWMHKQHKDIVFQHRQGDAYEAISNNHNELKKFAETIKMLK